MNDDSSSPFERDAHVHALIAAYLEAEEAGRPPDREAWLAEHGAFADELRRFLANHDQLAHVSAPLRDLAPWLPGPSEAPTLAPGAAPAARPLGTVRYFGDYELLEEIARGGMGVVYKARQTSLNRLVALKMILSGKLATSLDVARFRLEAEAAAGLDHPHIVPIYEVGDHDGQQYYSMRFIEGTSLAHRPPADSFGVANLVATVARAVLAGLRSRCRMPRWCA
jgi:serine/threonine-protein kinase